MQLWLDASDSSTLFDSAVGGSLVTADGSAIARWEDKSGNSRHFTQTTANARPILKRNIKNGKSVLRFDGSNDVMTRNTVTLTGNGSTFFIVAKRDSTLAGNFFTLADLPQFVRLVIATTTVDGFANGINWIGWQDNGTSPVNPSMSFTMSTSDYVVYGIRYDGGTANNSNSYKLSINNQNQTVSTGAAVSDISRNGTLMALGGRSTAQYTKGDICEVILYGTSLTDSETQTIGNYLTSKWNIV